MPELLPAEMAASQRASRMVGHAYLSSSRQTSEVALTSHPISQVSKYSAVEGKETSKQGPRPPAVQLMPMLKQQGGFRTRIYGRRR